MYVGQTDQESIMGPKGMKIKGMAANSNSIIDLDRSRNKVFINGNRDDIERARIQIRSASFLLIGFPFETENRKKVLATYASELDLVQQKFKVNITILPTLIRVDSEFKNEYNVRECTRYLLKLFYKEFASNILVFTSVEIPHETNAIVTAFYKKLIKKIEQQTGTSIITENIQYPALEDPILNIVGSIDGVCNAKKLLLEYIPAELIYDCTSNTENIRGELLEFVCKKYGTIVTQKQFQSGTVIVIRFLEKFIENAYHTLRDLTNLMVFERNLCRPEIMPMWDANSLESMSTSSGSTNGSVKDYFVSNY